MSYKLADGSLSTDYKIGDEFVVVGGRRDVGERTSLVADSGASSPYFTRRSSGGSSKHWEYLIPTTETKRKAQARKAKLQITHGDYIDSSEFTRGECERFCELAVECGAKLEHKAPTTLMPFFGVANTRGQTWACINPVNIFDNNITTQFREFLDKEKGMKQFTKDDLKDGMCVELRGYGTGVVFGNSIERLHSDIRRHNCTNSLIFINSYLPDLTTGDDPFDIMKVTDRDGTVLFERQPEKRKVTFELTEEQELELLKQLGLSYE